MTALFYVFVIILLVLFPSDTADTALQALKIWGTSVVPVLFPYMVFSRMLSKSLATFHLPPTPIAAALGMLGGSPSGAAAIASNAQQLTRQSTLGLCALTGTISPMFILGTIGAWTNHPAYCRALLLCHWLSAILCACLVRTYYRDHRNEVTLPPPEARCTRSAPNPISESLDAVLQVGGCIILYSVLSGMLSKVLHPLPYLQPLLHAVLEISGGVHAICKAGFSLWTEYVLLAAALGFSGLSILAQNHAMLKPLGIRKRQLVFFALLRSLISAIVMSLFLVVSSIS